jgi:hypothetical protein
VTFWDSLEKSRLSLQPTAARRVDAVLAHAQSADLIVFSLPVVAPSAPADGLDDDANNGDDDDRQSVASVLTSAVSTARQSGDGLIDDKGLLLLSMLKGQGLPPCMVALSGLESLPIGKRSGARKRASKCVEYHFGTDVKFFPLDNANDARLAMRHIIGYMIAHVFLLVVSKKALVVAADGTELSACNRTLEYLARFFFPNFLELSRLYIYIHKTESVCSYCFVLFCFVLFFYVFPPQMCV